MQVNTPPVRAPGLWNACLHPGLSFSISSLSSSRAVSHSYLGRCLILGRPQHILELMYSSLKMEGGLCPGISFGREVRLMYHQCPIYQFLEERLPKGWYGEAILPIRCVYSKEVLHGWTQVPTSPFRDSFVTLLEALTQYLCIRMRQIRCDGASNSCSRLMRLE